MPDLVNISEVRARLQLIADPAVDQAISRAIGVAQMQIETFLESPIVGGTYTDYFYLDSRTHSGIRLDGLYRLALTAGLVTDTPVVSCSYSLRGTYDPVDLSDGILNSNRGILHLPEEDYSDKYIRVAYSAGYTSPVNVPLEIKEAIMGFIPHVMMKTSNRSEGDEDVEAGAQSQAVFSTAQLAKFMRKIGFTFHPLGR